MAKWQLLIGVLIFVHLLEHHLCEIEFTIEVLELNRHVVGLNASILCSVRCGQTGVLHIMHQARRYHSQIRFSRIGITPIFFVICCVAHSAQDVSHKFNGVIFTSFGSSTDKLLVDMCLRASPRQSLYHLSRRRHPSCGFLRWSRYSSWTRS